MAKRFDKNRSRKTYPMMKRSPQWLPDIEAIECEFAINATQVVSIVTKYQYVSPVVTLGGQDNYNVWIDSSSNVGDNRYTFTIKRSATAAAVVQKVHLHISEAG
tara:strand:+ start:160 stop:471 length:312 start_codon:yes stop_codon:yes gene_type:complete